MGEILSQKTEKAVLDKGFTFRLGNASGESLEDRLDEDSREFANNVIENLRSDTSQSGYDYTKIHYALAEAVKNAQKHGNSLDPSKTVSVKYSIFEDKVELTVTDQAEKPCDFDLNKLIKKGLDAKAAGDEEFRKMMIGMYRKRMSKEKNSPGGNGLFYIGFHMDDARYEHKKGVGNIITMEKYRKI